MYACIHVSAFVKRIVENEEGCGSQRETSLPAQSSMHTYSYSKACKNPVHACIGYMSVSMGVCVFVCVCVCVDAIILYKNSMWVQYLSTNGHHDIACLHAHPCTV